MPHPPASPSFRPGRRFARAEAGAASPRVRLARLALDAALGLPDVLGGDAGPHGLRVTADLPSVVRGVSVTADGEGRYAVDLRLVARMVPLVPLAEEIRQRVRMRAGREGLDDQLGLVNVEFGAARDGRGGRGGGRARRGGGGRGGGRRDGAAAGRRRDPAAGRS